MSLFIGPDKMADQIIEVILQQKEMCIPNSVEIIRQKNSRTGEITYCIFNFDENKHFVDENAGFGLKDWEIAELLS